MPAHQKDAAVGWSRRHGGCILAPMLVAPLIACWMLLGAAFHQRGHGRREAFTFANVAFGVILTFITEGLSVFHSVAPVPLACAWTFAALLAVPFAFTKGERAWARVPDEGRATYIRGVGCPSMLGAIVAIVVITGAAGFLSAPCNFDSMTYHLVRVMRWRQNHSVAHYPANFHPQLYHGPWAEFAILNLQELTGSDRLAFGVQWAAMIACASLASLIAKAMTSNVNTQVFAALITVTLPAGMMQAESTQNNYGNRSDVGRQQ